MNNRLFPTIEQLKSQNNPLTDGEWALISYLDRYLPKDENWNDKMKLADYNGWLIFAQPFLNGTRPDVIIFNPFVGLVIYEVKDWDLKNYKWNTDDYTKEKKLHVYNRQGGYEVKKTPIKQVEYYKEVLIGQLVPNLGEIIDDNNKNYGLIKTGLYFHKATTIDAQEMFPSESFLPVFGYNSLQPNKLKEIVPDALFQKKGTWNRSWNDDILFWIHPPFHSLEQGTVLSLKGNQVKIAEPEPGHQRVRGVAGSGKTQALAYRAGKLASLGYKVLVVSFNITLWHYIKDMIARSPFNFPWQSLTFTHFHGFCKDRLNQFDAEWPKSPQSKNYDPQQYEMALEGFFRVTIPNTVINIIKDKNYDRYDAILIDEGQDYFFEWYDLLSRFFLNERDELLIVCDKKQNIYQRQLDWMDRRSNREGLAKLANPYIDLTRSYRLPKKIADMSNAFSEQFELNQDIKLGQIEKSGFLFDHIVWVNIEDGSWQANVYNAFLRLKKEGQHASDMVILLPTHKYGKECVAFFKNHNIEVNHVFEEDSEIKTHTHKKAFWMGDSRLKMSTIHSFKGWELTNIILFIPVRAPESIIKLDAIIYTAITRSRQNLIVLNANNRYSEFGKQFPQKWNEQNSVSL